MPFTMTTEAALIERVQRGDREASAELLKAYEPLLRKLVANLPKTSAVSAEDLLQEARIGFLQAIEVFDPSRRLRLSTLAVRYVRDATLAAVAEALPIRIPKRTYMRYIAAWQGVETYTEALQAATSGEHPMGAKTFRSVHEALHEGLEIDRPVITDESNSAPLSLHEVLAPGFNGAQWGPAEPDPFHDDAAHFYIGQLPTEDHRSVIRLAFGIGGGAPMIDSEISEVLGMSRATVQRRRTEALEILRSQA